MPVTHKYPIEDDDYYGATVCFQAVKKITPRIEVSASAGNQPNRPEITNNSQFLDQLKYIKNITAKAVGNSERVRLDKCRLFLPKGVTFHDGVSFDEFSLGRLGGGVSAALQANQTLGAGIKEGFSQGTSSFTDLFKTNSSSDLASLAATRIANLVPKIGNTLSAGVSSALRTTLNPNKQILFKEVNIRAFTFSFRLVPNSLEEAEAIKNIVKFFRTEAYPEDSISVNSFGIDIPIGYKFPNTFDITMHHNGQAIGHRILPSYLVSVQEVQNPTGSGFHRDGNFIETELTLNFRESRTLARRDIEELGY